MSQDQPEDEMPVQKHLQVGVGLDRNDRETVVEYCFEMMRAGATLNAAALQCGVSPSTAWRWLHDNFEWKKRYEEVKVERSQALMEHALYEMQQAVTVDQARIAEKRAKIFMMHAAKLNPKEFSDRLHSPARISGAGAQGISFTLNIGTQTEGQTRELTVVAQPEDSK